MNIISGKLNDAFNEKCKYNLYERLDTGGMPRISLKTLLGLNALPNDISLKAYTHPRCDRRLKSLLNKRIYDAH